MKPQRLHVLFLTGHDGLGADVAVHVSIARSLDRNQVRVSAATNVPQTPGASAAEAFASIGDLSHLQLDLGRTIGVSRGLGRARAVLRNAGAAANLVSVARWCQRNDVDIVHVTERPRQTLFGLMVAKLAGCACLIQAHISHYPHDATRFANLRLRLADAVVGVSTFTADTYLRNGRLDPSRVFAVHNAVDTTVFHPLVADAARSHMRRHFGLRQDGPVVGFVARLMRWKGHERLLEALALVRRDLPEVQLVLAGESLDSAPDGHGTYHDYLVRRANALGITNAVSFPGFVPREDMPAFYGALDLVVHPAPEEPFGLAVVEAMASGRPVIASDRGGTPEIIRDDIDGLLVPVDSAEAIAASMRRVLTNADLSTRLARAARERVVTTFTPDKQAAHVLEVYRTVIDRRRATARASTAFGRRPLYG